MNHSRRTFLKTLGITSAAWSATLQAQETPATKPLIDPSFLVRRDELDLNFQHTDGARRLSFAKYRGEAEGWREACRRKLAELCGITRPGPAEVKLLRSLSIPGVTVQALVMEVAPGLSIPAYLLRSERQPARGLVMAIQGHGDVEGVMGSREDYHNRFGLELARSGFTVLCPALRGFGVLRDLAWGSRGARCLDYWDWDRGHQFSLVTDGFIRGQTLIGQTVEDLLRWEQWLCQAHPAAGLDVAGISYGGDLAVLYPVFSTRVRRIFASGTLGSFSVVFGRCYNAPAHCIPGVLQWMDRSDIAGLNAPRPIALHYGQRDVPGPDNNSASYNETVEIAFRELRAIYRAFDAEPAVQLLVTPDRAHEMDVRSLLSFMSA